MARSVIVQPTEDLQSDSGAVLWSLVRGEQLEFPVVLSFLSNAGEGYTYEAVVMEADNVQGDDTIPTIAKPGGVNTTLTVYVPLYRGGWGSGTLYNPDDVVLYVAGQYSYWKLSPGPAVTGGIPGTDPRWIAYDPPNKVYIRFPSTLGATWSVQPTTIAGVYGFFELRVTESSGSFPKTWKPMRGAVKLLYSPTELVP